MTNENPRSIATSTGEAQDLKRHQCPTCRQESSATERATVVLATAYKFPQEHIVLEMATCERCGCVSFFNPAVTRAIASSTQVS